MLHFKVGLIFSYTGKNENRHGSGKFGWQILVKTIINMISEGEIELFRSDFVFQRISLYGETGRTWLSSANCGTIKSCSHLWTCKTPTGKPITFFHKQRNKQTAVSIPRHLDSLCISTPGNLLISLKKNAYALGFPPGRWALLELTWDFHSGAETFCTNMNGLDVILFFMNFT